MFNKPFKNFGAVLIVFALISPVFGQRTAKRPASKAKSKTSSTASRKPSVPRPAPTPKANPAMEKSHFDSAIAASSAGEKAERLVKFIAEYPKSEFKTRAGESLTGARAAMADASLAAGDFETATRLFRLAIESAPMPYGERLFSEIIATIPANLYWRGHKAQGIELAKLIEAHIATDANKLLLLSTFYLGSENGEEAKRIAEAAIRLDDKNSAAHQTLASAHRLNFDLESAAASFDKAVELDPESTIAKRSLADMKRAIGKPDEAEKIYREILSVNEKENQARTGLVLALFDLAKRTEAEAEMAKALEEAPGNVILLGRVAYWYAANKDGDKAVEYARRAIEKDARYIWSHIALGRGLMLLGKPVEAEQVLVAARKYGNFPTLQYEIASARFAAGFFREAAEELAKSFEVKDGVVSTSLGGRINQTADSFTKAIDMERRASIFAPQAADSAEDASRLKALMEFNNRLAADLKDEPGIIAAAESFVSGSDNMSVHRKLYAANLLLQNGVATEEAVKLSAQAVAGLDRSLDVADPGAAVMATELYDARNISFSRDDFLLIPDVPKQTLNSLMRGRVEQTTGLALLRQGKSAEASIRFRRALTVLPANSAWWRSAMWNLGTSLAAEGKDDEALETMVTSYAADKPNAARYILIEQLWTKVNGNRDGMEAKIGPNPLPTFTAASKVEAMPEPSPSPSVEANIAKESEAKTAVTEMRLTPETTPSPDANAQEPPQRIPEPSPSPEVIVEGVKATPTSTATPTPEVITESVTPTPTPTPEPSRSPEAISERVKPEPGPEVPPSREIILETVKSTPSPEVPPSPSPEVISGTIEATLAPSPKPARASVRARPEPSSSTLPAEPRTQSETLVSKVRAEKPGPPLFEPIIITIPGTPVPRRSLPETKLTEEKNPVEETKKTDEPQSGDDIVRPRIVDGEAISGELLPCEIGVARETVSLIKNSGSYSMLVSIEQGEDIKLVAGASSSPGDLEVKLEREFAPVSGRAMFVIRSISDKTGIYQVSFKAPCGKKDVIVRVR